MTPQADYKACPHTGLPIDETPCKTCGKPIIYFVFKDTDNKELRSVPRYHNGHCREIGRLKSAEKIVARYNRKQERKANGN